MFLLYLLPGQFLKKMCFSFSRKIMKIAKEKWGDPQSMLVGMAKKGYKETVKEINIIALKEEPSQQQWELEVCNHWFILLWTSNLILAWDINIQFFCCGNENKMELIQHIGHDDKEEKSWLQSLWVLTFSSSLINMSYLLSTF